MGEPDWVKRESITANGHELRLEERAGVWRIVVAKDGVACAIESKGTEEHTVVVYGGMAALLHAQTVLSRDCIGTYFIVTRGMKHGGSKHAEGAGQGPDK